MLSPAFIRSLKALVGDDHVLDGTEDLLARAAGAADVDVVVEPETGEQAAEILNLASNEGIPVVPRGSGTGPSGGAAAREGQLVLSTARMNRIRSVSAEDLIAVVEPGVNLDDFRLAVEEQGLFYPPDAETDRPATIGGTIGESARGLRALKYGGTRDYVMGMKIALPSGEIVRTGATTLKCVTGYDLSRLMAGSLGTLGLVTEVYLKLLPLPEARVTTVAVFDRARDAAEAGAAMLDAGLRPSALELMDRITLQAIAKRGEAPFPPHAGALLLVETDGLAVPAENLAVRVAEICRASRARDVRKAMTPHAAEVLWNTRRAAFSALGQMGRAMQFEEVRLPISKAPDFVGSLMALAEIEGISLAVFGHVGEGRLHPVLLTDPADSVEVGRAERALGKVCEEVVSLEGSLGRKRGPGVGKTGFNERRASPEQCELARRLKEAFDPKGIMNPQ